MKSNDEEMRLVAHEEVVVEFMKDPEYRKAHRIGDPPFQFAKQMYERRKALGLNLIQICQLAKVSFITVQEADSGDWGGLYALGCIAEALGCHLKVMLVPNDSIPKEEGGEK